MQLERGVEDKAERKIIYLLIALLPFRAHTFNQYRQQKASKQDPKRDGSIG